MKGHDTSSLRDQALASRLLICIERPDSETRDAATIVLWDTPENIVRRITFYDIESRPVQRNLTDNEKGLYLREIKRDIAYFNRSFRRADVYVDISGCSLDDASRKVQDALGRFEASPVEGPKRRVGTALCKDACTGLARIMHHTILFCRSGEPTRADVPSGGIGVRTLAVRRVWG